MSDDLRRWLGQQYDTEEQVAREATPGPWRNAPTARHHVTASGRSEEAVFASPPDVGATVVATTGEAVERRHLVDAEHIARHNPARVLREIDAKRRISELHDYYRSESLGNAPACFLCGPGFGWPCPTMKALALPYSDKPGYQEEWRP